MVKIMPPRAPFPKRIVAQVKIKKIKSGVLKILLLKTINAVKENEHKSETSRYDAIISPHSPLDRAAYIIPKVYRIPKMVEITTILMKKYLSRPIEIIKYPDKNETQICPNFKSLIRKYSSDEE